MDEHWTIPVIVGPGRATLHGSTNRPDEGGIAGIVDVDGETLKASLGSVMSKLDEVLSDAAQYVKTYHVAEVKVSLAIDSSGTVSVLGLVKANVGAKGAIEVKFVPRS